MFISVLKTDATCISNSDDTCVFGASCKEDDEGDLTCECDDGFEEDGTNKICSKQNLTFFLH